LGIKEAGNVENVNKVKPLVPDNISFLTGNDTTLVDNFVKQGYNGITAIIAGIYPKEMKEAAELTESGKVDEANKILEIVLPGFDLMKVAGFLPSLKYILRKRGVPAGYCAPPMLDPTEEHQAALDKAFNLTS
jgi:4-hydroxy-tetrahydrodipicolinate synthase